MIFPPKPYLVYNIHLGRLLADKRIRGAEGEEASHPEQPRGGRRTGGRAGTASRAGRGRVKRRDVRRAIGRRVKARRAVCPIAAQLYSEDAESCPRVIMQRGAHGDRSRFSRQEEWCRGEVKRSLTVLLVINRQQDCIFRFICFTFLVDLNITRWRGKFRESSGFSALPSCKYAPTKDECLMQHGLVLHNSFSLKGELKPRCCPSVKPLTADYVIHSFVFCCGFSTSIIPLLRKHNPKGPFNWIVLFEFVSYYCTRIARVTLSRANTSAKTQQPFDVLIHR